MENADPIGVKINQPQRVAIPKGSFYRGGCSRKGEVVAQGTAARSSLEGSEKSDQDESGETVGDGNRLTARPSALAPSVKTGA